MDSSIKREGEVMSNHEDIILGIDKRIASVERRIKINDLALKALGSTYSNKSLTDDNFDDEYEKLRDLLGNLNSDKWVIYDTLPDGFTEQDSKNDDGDDLGFSEWVRSGGIRPDHAHDHCQVLCSGEIAFQFKNKFLSLHFNEAI